MLHSSDLRAIAGPTYAGFAGGVMNTSVIAWENDFWALGCGRDRHWMDSLTHPKSKDYLRGQPIVLKVDPKRLTVIDSFLPEVKNNPFEGLDTVLEDLRLFSFQARIWASGSVVFPVRHPVISPYKNVYQVLLELDVSKKTLSFIGSPQLHFPLNPIEKNWIYLEDKGRLLCFYSFSPYVVFYSLPQSPLDFTRLQQRDWGHDFGALGDSLHRISFSVNPIGYDEGHVLSAIHKFDDGSGYRIYSHWAVLLDRFTLLPVKISRIPLIEGGSARGRLPGIIYLMGVARRENGFIFSAGEGDDHSSVLEISKAFLEQHWIPFDPAAYDRKIPRWFTNILGGRR